MTSIRTLPKSLKCVDVEADSFSRHAVEIGNDSGVGVLSVESLLKFTNH